MFQPAALILNNQVFFTPQPKNTKIKLNHLVYTLYFNKNGAYYYKLPLIVHL